MVNRDVNMAKFIVDTGAMFTCCNYKIFDIHLEESELADNEIKALGGFVRSIPVTFYKCSLKQFTHTSHTKNRHIIGSYATLGI